MSKAVQMQFMRPGQLQAAARRFPAVYVPFGLIEWHGKHLPLGNDALKVHAILVKCAEQFGGVVYPPVWFHAGFGADFYPPRWSETQFTRQYLVPVIAELFERLKRTGFRVILGVSGHNTHAQIEMINQALQPVLADGTAVGMGLWEITLSRSAESDSDHAAKWETSNMMFLYPDLVDLSELGEGPINLDMKPPSGIGGLDPRKSASAKVGERNVELAANAIGRKAQELLNSLPPDKRTFNLKSVSSDCWWLI